MIRSQLQTSFKISVRGTILFLLMNVRFYYAAGDGSVVWKCSQQGKVPAIKSLDQERIVLEDGSTINAKPFVSYYRNTYRGTYRDESLG